MVKDLPFADQSGQLSVGDKMAGRHGKQGRHRARIVPEEDMPFPVGRNGRVDILLNPLGRARRE